jgi:hypothetical protein
MREEGFEPTHLSVPDPKSGASANSATLAKSYAVAVSGKPDASSSAEFGSAHTRRAIAEDVIPLTVNFHEVASHQFPRSFHGVEVWLRDRRDLFENRFAVQLRDSNS